MVTLFTGFMSDNENGAGDSGWLNQCLQCDEKLSGPDFRNLFGCRPPKIRQRKEIERNPEEQCSVTDVDWVTFFETS
jgi:hypothetical protein